jgi:mono/diheme cytochrome c family protein
MTSDFTRWGIWMAGSALLLVAGCRQDMHDGPNYRKYRESNFFADGRSARMPVDNTVARGHLRADPYLYTGKRENGALGNDLPEGVLREGYGMKELLERGQNRFQIYCTPCHSRLGDGRGVIVQRGFQKLPPSFHEERLKVAPLGYFYDVMTNGFGVMLSYNSQLSAQDRWAVASYIRALQLSQDASIGDVPPERMGEIKPQATPSQPIEAATFPGTSMETGQRGRAGRDDAK